jgi:hypothetical protein
MRDEFVESNRKLLSSIWLKGLRKYNKNGIWIFHLIQQPPGSINTCRGFHRTAVCILQRYTPDQAQHFHSNQSKIVPVLFFFNWAPRHKGVFGSEGIILRPRHFMEVSGQLHALATLPLGKEPLAPVARSLVGLRAVLDAVKRKIPSPGQESNPRTSIVQPVA